jgi:drug/metabolite transporter (DMT)-like permease
MGVAFFLWDKSLKNGDPRIIGALSYLDPMLSTLILIAFGGAHFTWVTGAAMILIILGAVVGAMANKS